MVSDKTQMYRRKSKQRHLPLTYLNKVSGERQGHLHFCGVWKFEWSANAVTTTSRNIFDRDAPTTTRLYLTKHSDITFAP